MGYTSNHTYHVLPAGVFNKCICIIAWCHVVSVYCSIEILSCKSIMSVGIFGVLYLIAKIAMITEVSSVPKFCFYRWFAMMYLFNWKNFDSYVSELNGRFVGWRHTWSPGKKLVSGWANRMPRTKLPGVFLKFAVWTFVAAVKKASNSL